MLLIPDIHINSQYRDSIIKTLSDTITNHPDEDHIILLGDYVYMFSYDRDALLALYKLIIGRYHTGKTVYVLAGNHDWHGQHFVYEEARQAREIIFGITGETTNQSAGAIHFITTPQTHQIEGESVLFMPYMIDWTTSQDLDTSQHSQNSIRSPLYQALTQSSNKYEQASGRLNLTLEYYTQTQQIDTIIHHYYTADTQFPGLRTQFSYRDVALDSSWLNGGYDLISGHIHHPFVYGRYLCCGSLRTTAANETNQFKYYWIKHHEQIQGHQIQINPHLSIEYPGSALSGDQLQAHRDYLAQQHTNQLSSDHYQVQLHHTPMQTNLTTLSIVTDHQHDISQMIESALSQAIKSAKPKYKTIINHDHTDLSIDTESLKTSIVQRKDTLTHYIQSKYPDQQEHYITLLEELQIIDKK